jgi:serine/threonine protein kinase
MFSKLKTIFAADEKDSTSTSTRSSPVNIERRFQVISMTSQGSMSRVCKALDRKTGRTVCLKVQDVQKQAEAAARAVRHGRMSEGEILERIKHPNVVRHYEHGITTRKEHFLAMEFVSGVSLKFQQETGAFDARGKLEALLQAAEGLAAVHAAGFIHHDFGPRNVLFNTEGQVKLIDFGLAVPNTPEFRRPGNRTGSLDYMAPELVRREPIDVRIDIFSFGAMAFELMTNRLPYEASTSLAILLKRMNHDPLDPLAVKPKMPPRLADFLRKSIARNRDQRYKSMAEVIAELRGILG